MYGRINETTLTDIADAIRSQYGVTTKYYPSLMAQAIRNIPSVTQSDVVAASDAIIGRTITSLITNSFHNIGEHAFSDCNLLRKVHLTSVIGTVGFEAFANCAVLETVNITGNCILDSQVFFGCPKLNRVDFTDVIQIGNYCFQNCTSLNTVILRTTPSRNETTGLYMSNAFLNTPIASGTGYIYVPEEYILQYTDKNSGSPWYSYVEQFRAIEDYPEICG